MKTLSLSKVTGGLRTAGIFEKLIAQHQIVVEARDMVLAWAQRGLSALISAGEILIDAQNQLSGDFEDWFENAMASLPEDQRFSIRTAYNYMRAVRFKAALGDAAPEFASMKELYIMAGILPAPPEAQGKGNGEKPLYVINVRTSGIPPEKWDPMERQEFIAKAKPVVELYERVRQAEEEAA